MSDTETNPTEEAEEAEEPEEAEETKEAEEEPLFDVSTPEGRKAIFEIMCIAKGIDPNQVQGMAKFTNPDNNDERSYYPTQHTALAIAQLRMFGRAFYKKDEWNEYESIADLLSIGYMGYKGFKSEQYKDITSGQPNLDKLQGLPEATKSGVLSGLLGRRKTE